MENKITSIQVTQDLKDILDSLGKRGETYEEIIRRLINKEVKK